MGDVLVVGIAGFLASFVDGALGMGFGPTSSSILMASGLSPTSVSATVNIAKIASGVAGGVSHWRVGNIDRRLVARLAIPGTLGAVIGTTILANVDADVIRPILAALLFVIGLRILIRFRKPVVTARREDGSPDTDVRGVEVAGAVGGATNGMIGAWGPVVTPFLLHRGVLPRLVVGSVNTAEVAVAVVATGSLLTAGSGDMRASIVAAMLIGGALAAPLAAVTIRHIPARVLGLAVAALLMLTNVRELVKWADLGRGSWVVYAVTTVAALVAMLPARPRRIDQAPVAPQPDTSPAVTGP